MGDRVSVGVSVIVPLYNKSVWIDRCLDSILSQTFTDFEIIVVDDGSTDDGPAKVAARGDERIRLIRQANAGPGAARNCGVSEARGELIAMLDADDAWDPDYLAESVRLLEGYGEEVACITWAMTEYPGKRSSYWRWAKIGISEGRCRMTPDTPVSLLFGIVSNMLPSSVVIRKAVFRRYGGFYAKNRCLFAEDAWLFLQVMLNHEVAFHKAAPVQRYCDASELSMNLQGPRPLEPFLLEPDVIRAACPAGLQPLLRGFLAWRAIKTASVYGYFGLSSQARSLMHEFVSAGDWRAPFFFPALAGCTPAGKWLGALARTAKVNLRVPTG
jgi:glycosyltransferase involved in cell wall biosynthesis